MKRYLDAHIATDVTRKMVILTGPRQVGKTTLARQVGEGFRAPLYLNYDALADRRLIEAGQWLPTHDYVVLDEIHTMPHWKPYLKGVFDSKPATQGLLVTGSARLDTFRQAGESLAGRYFRWRLCPFSIREFMPHSGDPESALDALLRFGGFPEPLFAATDVARQRWQSQYFTDLVREDVLEFSRINEVRAMRHLVELLRRRTGSPLSFDSLGRDLGISPTTVRHYIDILEALHIVFLVRPFHRNIARAQTKAPKLYFHDWAYIEEPVTGGIGGTEGTENAGARLENLVAASLYKHVCYLNDSTGSDIGLHYLRTTSGKEVDFVLTNDSGDATHFIEVKWADEKPGFTLRQLAASHPEAQSLQLVRLARHPYQVAEVQVQPLAHWLAELAA
jgi:predicted AAA+ superfamily ATPase